MPSAALPTLLLLALLAAPAVTLDPGDRGVGAHGHGGARGASSRGARGALQRSAGEARLPIPTPQEIDALRQLLRILASLAGAASADSQLADESAPFTVSQTARRPPAAAAATATVPARRPLLTTPRRA